MVMRAPGGSSGTLPAMRTRTGTLIVITGVAVGGLVAARRFGRFPDMGTDAGMSDVARGDGHRHVEEAHGWHAGGMRGYED